MIGAYAVSKTALLGLTKVLSQTLGPENIRVNCVAPGIVKTKFASTIIADKHISDTALLFTPLKR